MSGAPKKSVSTPPIASVDNALRVLLMLQRSEAVRISDASAELGIGVSTAHRLMAALSYRGFVEQDKASRAYRAGPAWAGVGLAALRNLGIRGVLRPLLEGLRDHMDETMHLVELQDADVLFLDSVEARRTLRTTSRIGVRMPAHCTSGGKALLAHLQPEALSVLYPSDRLPVRTPRSIATRVALDRELARVRDHGYAVADGEGESEIAAIAVAVCDATGSPRVSIAASGPRSRLRGAAVPPIAEALMRAADHATALVV